LKHLITIVGPTAIGKTSLSIALAKHYNTEIISADSRQIFKEMSIGTAKPSVEEMDGVKHHFVDAISVTDRYTAGQFEKEAIEAINTIFEKNDVAILAGGSGLYVNAVIDGIDEVPSDLKIREELNTSLKEEGIRPLQLMLQEKDPAHYNRMDIRNPQRLIRALEVCLVTGEPYSQLRKEEPKVRDFNIIKIGLEAPRETIYDRINQRVDIMMKQGLEEEVKALTPHKELNSLKTVGYQELFDYFDGNKTKEEAIDKIKQNTRNFAKRQLTWFKKKPDTKWFDISETENIIPYITKKIK
jgi:tRNA dimethylallyltransferase